MEGAFGSQRSDLGNGKAIILVKTIFITQDDPFYVRELFDELSKVDRSGVDVVGIAIAPAMNKSTLFGLARQMLDFYGPLDFIRMGTRFVLAKIGARLPSVLRGTRTFSVKQAGERAGIDVFYIDNVNDVEFVKSILDNRIDVIVSVASPQIFRADLINAPRLGCINIHNAKLPEYKGMLPNFWQMYDGRTSVGTTVHRINEAIDEGAILLQDETEVLPDESLDSLIRRTKRKGVALILQVLRRMGEGSLETIEMPDIEASYYSFPTRRDVVEFRRRGHRLL